MSGKLIALSEILIGPCQDSSPVREILELVLAEKGYKKGAIEYPRIGASDVQLRK